MSLQRLGGMEGVWSVGMTSLLGGYCDRAMGFISWSSGIEGREVDVRRSRSPLDQRAL